MITLSTLRPAQRRQKSKRVGRGDSSGKGTTAGRGTKGQRARTGGRNKTTRRALKALIERTPKTRGFRSARTEVAVVTLLQLTKRYPEGQIISAALLQQDKMISNTRGGLKIIGALPLKKKFTIKANAFSAQAKAAIEAAGGTAVVLTSKA